MSNRKLHESTCFLPSFSGAVRTVRVFDRLLSGASKERENRSTAVFDITTVDRVIDGFVTEAFNSMGSEVCCGCFILRVLEAADATGSRLAHRSSACEEMAQAAVVIPDGDVGLEKMVDRRRPCALEGR